MSGWGYQSEALPTLLINSRNQTLSHSMRHNPQALMVRQIVSHFLHFCCSSLGKHYNFQLLQWWPLILWNFSWEKTSLTILWWKNICLSWQCCGLSAKHSHSPRTCNYCQRKRCCNLKGSIVVLLRKGSSEDIQTKSEDRADWKMWSQLLSYWRPVGSF